MNAVRADWARLYAWALRPETTLMLSYGVGLVASHMLGDGAAGQPLLGLAAPLAMGLLIRRGSGLSAVDTLRLAAVHIVVATCLGAAGAELAVAMLQNLIAIACSTAAFLRLRSRGFIVSEVRVALAVSIAAAAGAIAGGSAGALVVAGQGGDLGAVLVHWVAAWISATLLLGVVLTRARRDASLADEFDADEPTPALWEGPAAACLVAALILASLNGGHPEAALAASVAMLWFALRLGLSATWLAAFCFSAALLAYASDGRWPAFFNATDPIEAEIMRYLALTLLAGPSVLVAAYVHDQKRLRRVFAYRAMHDGLTKLVNRSRFEEVLQSATHSAQTKNRRFALFLIDLDHFKSVNDGFGHQRGDALLVEVAQRLRNSVRATDVVARIGGDEFAVVAPLSTVEDGMKLARRLVENVNQTCELHGVTFHPSITLGGVLSPDCEGDPQRLMLLADEALYAAKAAGRNCWRFSSFTAEPDDIPLWRPNADGQPAFETVYLD